MLSLPSLFSSSSQTPPVASSSNDSPDAIAKQLQHYHTSGGALPPSSRFDPLEQRRGDKVSITDLVKFGFFVAGKATELATDFVTHHVWGPRKKSWGIEMTMISSFMRNIGQHSHMADIVTIRTLMGVSGLYPLPSDATVTPVTFRVRKRKLRGILSEFDNLETGKRELYGEWVVGRRLWQRIQADWKKAKAADPGKKVPKSKERVVLYLHGGAYFTSSAATHRVVTIPLSKHTDARVFSIDYRLAPETRFPGPLHDAASAYFRLVDDLHIPPENIIIAGDSAGGGLSLGLVMYLRDNNYPLPSGMILFSPWVDLTMSCDSWDSNAEFDVVPRPQPDQLNPIFCYLGEEGMDKYLTHPYASPLFGDLKGLPPMLIQAGDAEVLRDEITLLAHKATLAGVEVRHELYEDAVHVFQMFPFLEAATEAFISCRDFVTKVLPLHQSHSPRELGLETRADLEHEMANEKTKVVTGDGTEGKAGKEAFEELANATESEDSVAVDVSENDPSWGYKETQGGEATEANNSDDEPGPHPVDAGPIHINPIRRTLSTASSMFPHRRNPSLQRVFNPPATPSTERIQQHSRPSKPVRQGSRLSTLTLTSMDHPTAPAIRARTASHPDVFSLIQQWSEKGPANKTFTYKPATQH